MEIIPYKGRPFSVFVDGFVSHFALLQLYSNHLTVIFETSRSNRMMAAILNLLIGPGRRIFKRNVHSLADGQTVTKYSAI